MTTYEDLQREIYKDLMVNAGSARKWQGFAQVDTSGHAAEIANRSYNAFSTFLIEDYIPHGCYNLPEDSSRPFAGRFRAAIEATGEILEDYVGSSNVAVSRRREVMKFVNGDLAEDIGRSTKILNGIGRLDPIPLKPAFTNEVALRLYDSLHELKISSRDYVWGDVVSTGLGQQPAANTTASEISQLKTAPSPSNSEDSWHRASLSPENRTGQVSQEWSGKRQRGGTSEPQSPDYRPRLSSTQESRIIAPGSPPSRLSPSVVPETTAASPAANPSDFGVPPSAQPSKRAREETQEAEHSNKRRQFDARPEGRSTGRDM